MTDGASTYERLTRRLDASFFLAGEAQEAGAVNDHLDAIERKLDELLAREREQPQEQPQDRHVPSAVLVM